jgi:hypothetical protein
MSGDCELNIRQALGFHPRAGAILICGEKGEAMSTYTVPGLRYIADLSILVAEPIEVGTTAAGIRRLVPILGGISKGPDLRGRILEGGADFQVIRRDGVTELEARYVIATESGALVYVENTGLRHGPPELMERMRRGEEVDPAAIYFRTTPRFETAARELAWLTRSLFLGSGARFPDRVEIGIFQVD